MPNKPTKVKPNKKDSQLLIRISTVEREQFSQICEELDTTAAREIRLFIRRFIKKNKSVE
jgi:antitoxin component of RelBE/YafQ-DinJ toxin-antitoxin module